MRSAVAKLSALCMLGLLGLRPSSPDAAPFDLAGPTVEVEVSRDGRTLPAAEVPSPSIGDRLSIKADLPAGESARYLMVAAFLRGATNRPPPNWFLVCETWTRRCDKDGLTLTVPPEAEQLLVFLAPRTGGAVRTLVNAVRGRPGAFVRTSREGKLFVKLRDDPAIVNVALLDVRMPPSAAIDEMPPSPGPEHLRYVAGCTPTAGAGAPGVSADEPSPASPARPDPKTQPPAALQPTMTAAKSAPIHAP